MPVHQMPKCLPVRLVLRAYKLMGFKWVGGGNGAHDRLVKGHRFIPFPQKHIKKDVGIPMLKKNSRQSGESEEAFLSAVYD